MFKTLLTGTTEPPRRKKIRKLYIIIAIGIVIIGYLLYKAEKERSQVAEQLEKTTAELEELEKSKQAGEDAGAVEAAQRNDQDLAREVLGKLRNHIIIPDFPKPTVATIMDVETLKRANSFYEPAEDGDHLIITERRAILYDSDRDIILDIVPVQAEREAEPANITSESETIAPEVTPDP